MILDKRDDLPAFREAVRGWMKEAVPSDWRSRMANASAKELVELQRWWMRERHKVGLAIGHWPSNYGGADLGLAHMIVIAEESVRADAPPANAFMVSMNHIPATLMAWGSEYQRRRYLPTVAEGVIWCQGFSEPNSGSDLASLRTRAHRDGDHYVINGQKIWSSLSMHADYCILLARTDPEARKHQGITFFIMDMRAPGVEVRPIRQSTGEAEFAELFLDNVHIPAEERVGEENQGWTVSQSTLTAERGVIAFEGAERFRYDVEAFYRDALQGDAAWLKDDQLRREFMAIFAEMQTNRRLVRRLLRENEHSDHVGRFSMLPAIIKVATTTLRKRIADFRVKTGGVHGQLFSDRRTDQGDDPMRLYVGSFAGPIAGGTNEIMRNLIAERGLNLPR